MSDTERRTEANMAEAIAKVTSDPSTQSLRNTCEFFGKGACGVSCVIVSDYDHNPTVRETASEQGDQCALVQAFGCDELPEPIGEI